MDSGLMVFLLNALTRLSKWISYFYLYRIVYAVFGLLTTRRFAPAKKLHRYAILVAARNEEAVIGNLIDSIRKQDYPAEQIDIFVVADNCTDRTAQLARQGGAICYERTDPARRTKGFALQFLVECIRRDYGIDSYEGYFIFDADNLLKSDYIRYMNDAFDAGEKIVTSYRNTKNFGDNWISASYGIHWLRTIRSEHRARSVFHLATRIQGTGFLFASELIQDGWNYTSLTEDRAFCADAVVKGYRISYQDAAEFYDEQPTDLKIAFRQRIRWSKGHLQAFRETGPKLCKHMFVTGGKANAPVKAPDNTNESAAASRGRRLVGNLRLRFMSYDMLTVVFPRSLFSSFRKIAVYLLSLFLVIQSVNGNLFLLNITTLGTLLISYAKGILVAAYIFLIERKRIAPIPLLHKIWYCLTFPLFDIIGRLSLIVALFTKVEWKPIPHKASINISEMQTRQ